MAEKADLEKECERLGLSPKQSRRRKNKDTGEYYMESTVKDLRKAIQGYYLQKYKEENKLSPFMLDILKLDSPMLALQIKNKKQEIQDQIWKDEGNWIFEEKIDGCRCMLCYDIDYGWDMYSRGISTKDQLPISYKTKLLMPRINPEILKRYNVSSFIIDTELVPLSKNINSMADGTELVADTQLNLVTGMLGALDDLSHKMQETNPLKFIAFDIIMYNRKWLTDLPLFQRDKFLNGVVKILKVAGMDIRLEKVQTTMTDKHNFYEKILSNNGEGVVAKDLNSKYDLLGRRAGEWIKIKRTVSQSLLMEKVGDTVDAFITGFKEGTPGTINEGLVGALEFSVYLTDDFDNYITDEKGNPIVHHIATVSGISQELRFLISNRDEFGRVKLNNSFYGKVATIDGQDISSRNQRFAHATFQGWRPDRNALSCKMRKSILDKLVM